MMIFDHLGFNVGDFAGARRFFLQALQPLGIGIVKEGEGCAMDNGGPGLREHYHPHYYGAFVIGPDGHNIEAVCHAPQE